LVLPIVGLNNVTSAAVILLYFSSGLDEQSQTLVLKNLSLAKSQAAVPADEFQIPNHRQYLSVRP